MAKTAACTSNLKQIALGLTMYTGNNDEWYPYRCYRKADPWNWTRANHSCCNYGHGSPDPNVRMGPRPWDYEMLEPYIPPGNLYVCPVKGGDYKKKWPYWQPGGRLTYSWTNYACFAGHAAHDITRHPVTPEGVYLSPPRTPEGTNRKAWRRAVPHRMNDNPRHVLAGDILVGWRENHFTTPAGYQGRFTGSHIDVPTDPQFTAKPPNPGQFQLPRHNFAFVDGSVTSTSSNFRIVIAYLNYSRSYWVAQRD